jgi:indole-3-glycerol phosphate synthase
VTADAPQDFLAAMAASSAARADALHGSTSEQALLDRIAASAEPPRLRLDPAGFDLIAEIKPVSPSAGILANGGADPRQRAIDYVTAGACAVSVLTEPQRFGGSTEDLARVADEIRPHGVPALAKDFFVDPWQIAEARAAGAGGVLLIVRMLDDGRLDEMLDCASRLGMFVLVEAFDAPDLERAGRLLEDAGTPPSLALVGVNCRDLRTLGIDAERLERLAPACPAGRVAVAESGLVTAGDAGRAAALGYRVGLVGTALMRSPDPAGLVRAMLEAGRAEGVA